MRVIDSHTEGEPTRCIVEGGPDLGEGSMAERRERFAEDFDDVRSFCVNEPRGHDAVVGALICKPVDSACAAGVVFFNNVGFLGMCGHGLIGVVASLVHLQRIGPGQHLFETPVGVVQAHVLDSHTVRIANVPAYRHRKDVSVAVPGIGHVVGDIAWGGNWFFLVKHSPVAVEFPNLHALNDAAQKIQDALDAQGIRGADQARIDHIELFGPPQLPSAHSKNFVLCPGGAYDRSPCGTGTSAKLACLAEDGLLLPGQPWVQESIVGSHFIAHFDALPNSQIRPHIQGRAFVVADSQLLRMSGDPFGGGMRPAL